jgi:2-polyprenyl-3-methyl-5-hydroxy-6-metoxy-1,4-benzoquinol methylase
MKYDLIKDKFARFIDNFPIFRKLFYLLLDLLLLRQWYVKSKIKKAFPQDKKINFYDAGAGFGQYSWFVLNHYKNAHVLAVDLKTDYMNSFAKYCSKLPNKEFTAKQADLVKYIPNEKYDLIIAVDILEHIEDDRQVLANFHQAISPGGKLIISSPSTFDESAKFVAEHVRPGYSKKEIIKKLEAAGFQLKSFEYSYGKMGHIYWQLAMKWPLKFIEINNLLILLLPFYYLIFYPIILFFMAADFFGRNNVGTGIIVVAEKNKSL